MRAKIAFAWFLLMVCGAITGFAYFTAHVVSEMNAAGQYAAAVRWGRLVDLWIFPTVIFLWALAGLLIPTPTSVSQWRPPRTPFMARAAEFSACLLIFSIPTVTHHVHRALALATAHHAALRQAVTLVAEAINAREAFDESAAWARLLQALATDRDNAQAKELLLNAPTLQHLLAQRSAKLSPQDRFERFKLAMWLREQGDEEAARQVLKAILAVDPEDFSALRALGPPANRPLRPTPPPEHPPATNPPGIEVPEGMVYIPAGEYLVRQNRERVKVAAFCIDRWEVTNGEYGMFLEEVERNGDEPYRHPNQPPNKDHTPAQWGDPIFNAPDLPVVGVDWFDAYAFAKWANKRLPTELEWEAAARGPAGRIFPWGDRWERWASNTPDRFLFYDLWGWATVEWAGWIPSAAARDAFIKLGATTPAGAFPRDQSPTGCLDMAGNVEEWVADVFTAEGPVVVVAESTICGIRGGSWVYGGLERPLYYRTGAAPLSRTNYRGFRCAK